jgi:hypothetical protein
VPAIVAQPTQMLDPVTREVNSITDAVKARIPGLRGELLPKRDIFGEPIQTKERLGAVSPVTETTSRRQGPHRGRAPRRLRRRHAEENAPRPRLRKDRRREARA